MIVRKNITLENIHLKKLEPLIIKHEGNLSAAIRDSIDMTDAALLQYGTIEKAIKSITTETKKLTGREQSIESGKNVLIASPVFQWMLNWTKGIPLDHEILDELLDPLKIKTTSELDKYINAISRESGWNCEVSIFCMDNMDPETATVTITGNNELYRDFIAQIVIMFLVYNKHLDIDVIHRRATSTRIDLKKSEPGANMTAANDHFGYLKDAVDEFVSKKEFWTNLIEIYSSLNYNMVSLHKDQYEQILAGNTLLDLGIFESLSKKHISNIAHPEFLELLKKTHESMKIIDKIELFDNGLNIYHNYKNERAIQKLKDYYILLLSENGHQYEAKYSSSLLVLNHVCCRV
ncbi:MAG: hypothetical protein Q7J35_02010 [Candidatus Methanoperedens sp.]|nr:hypothetical protein [Candidatus Methanoperedens sp.]